MLKDTGYVFSGKYKSKSYKPDYIDPYKSYKYVIASLLFLAGIWALFYRLGVSI